MANAITKIHQALHGYQNGHQLLASSMTLSPPAKRILLFQSDLTGSFEKGFESYITGYPIAESSIYVFARTWYAPEMERPGCVWTHSLILEYSDLGKFSELDFLNDLFLRPSNGDYKSYLREITLDVAFLTNKRSKYEIESTQSFKAVLSSVYNHPDQTILIPTSTAAQFETDIIRIWSEQWPRLRRGFKFCSGSLGLKTLDESEFDLQFVPERTASLIARQSSNPEIINIKETIPEDWTSIFDNHPREAIKKFLWAFGADIEGKRANYIPLVKLFQAVNTQRFELSEVNSYVHDYFPDINKGRFLKKNLFGTHSILPVSEKELVQYLISESDATAFSLSELEVPNRIISLVNSHKMSISELATLLEQIRNFDLDDQFWAKLHLDSDMVFKLLENDQQLAPLLVKYWPNIAEDRRVWRMSYETQLEILENINLEYVKFEVVLKLVLEEKSRIIFDFRRAFGADVLFTSLDLVNTSKGEDFLEDWLEYMVRGDGAFTEWLHENVSEISRSIFTLLFRYLSTNELGQLNIGTKAVIAGFDSIQRGSSRDLINVAACKLLGLGFSNSSANGCELVERTFSYVYGEVCSNRLGDGIWRFFSKDHPINDYSDFFNPFAVLTYFKKSKRRAFDIDHRDIGQQLVIRTVNHFIRSSWKPRSFLEIFTRKREFKEALLYCYTFDDGIDLIRRLLQDIDKDRISLNEEQLEIVKKILS